MTGENEKQRRPPSSIEQQDHLKGKCDICDKKDGFKGFNLQRCKTCSVAVHEECYALAPTNKKNPRWECHACQATPPGGDRPRECALCSVEDGTHAMHPLYDEDGKDGKPLMLAADPNRGKPRREAWVHSLCAFYIGSNSLTRGTVYGCDVDGRFEGDEADDGIDTDDDDEREFDEVPKKRQPPAAASSDSSSQDSNSQNSSNNDNEPEISSCHHFVICGKNPDGSHNEWSKRIAEFRTLKCSICGRNDRRKESLRIPVQCCAGGEEELEEFRERHPELNGDCFVAMHIGCARWKNDTGNQHVYYYPGLREGDGSTAFTEPICNCYCEAHARDIRVNHPNKKQNQKPTGSRAVPSRLQRNRLRPPPVATTTKKRPSVTRERDMDAATAPRPTKRAHTTTTTSSSEADSSRLEKVAKEVQKIVDSTSLDERRPAVIECKKKWKTKLKLPKDEFRAFWKKVGENVIVPENKTTSSTTTQRQQQQSNNEPKKDAATIAAAITSRSASNDAAAADDLPEVQDLTTEESVATIENRWKHLWMPHYRESYFTVEWSDEESVDTLSS